MNLKTRLQLFNICETVKLSKNSYPSHPNFKYSFSHSMNYGKSHKCT